jgi:hypothetical protein
MLAWLELVNIALFGWIVFIVRGAPATKPNLSGFALFALHLAVGASYWLVKGGQLRAGRSEPSGIGVFRWLRLACQAGLVAGLLVIAFGAITATSWSAWLPGALLFGLAAAEHVNYFHWQLMYDNRADLRRLRRTRRLHRSHLHGDLRAFSG